MQKEKYEVILSQISKKWRRVDKQWKGERESGTDRVSCPVAIPKEHRFSKKKNDDRKSDASHQVPTKLNIKN
jgi:hypothetical protein